MTAVLPATDRQLLARAARAQRDGRLPSLLAGVVRDGALAWSGARGAVEQPHTDVQYRLGSITKTVTAVAVMRLRDEGLLGLGDPLEQHLPGTPFGDRTVGQLLAHVAGVRAETPGPWWERTPGADWAGLSADLSGSDAPHPPGRRFHYSNLGYGVLGELLARLRGRPWAEVVREEVLLPLEMRRTTPRPSGRAAQGWAVHPWADVVQPEPEHDAGALAPAGQLWSTLADLARLAALLLGDTGGVLSPDTVEEMADPASVDVSAGDWAAYGLGVQVLRVDGVTLIGHGGSMPGFLAGVLVDRDAGLGGVTLANATTGLDGALVPDLLGIVRAAEPLAGTTWSPLAELDDRALELVGTWYWGTSGYSLRLGSDGLLQLAGLKAPGRTSRFRPRDDGTWLGLDGYHAGEVLHVVRRGGALVALDLGSFVFSRTPYDATAPHPGGLDPDGWRAGPV
jgi:CubicO group peptidase (beta-lactamase class C family)